MQCVWLKARTAHLRAVVMVVVALCLWCSGVVYAQQSGGNGSKSSDGGKGSVSTDAKGSNTRRSALLTPAATIMTEKEQTPPHYQLPEVPIVAPRPGGGNPPPYIPVYPNPGPPPLPGPSEGGGGGGGGGGTEPPKKDDP
jgi:hypothetical protein